MPHKVSPSQVATFHDCERKWGWAYLDKIPVPQNRYAALGERVHAVLEAWLQNGTPPDPDEVLVLDGHETHPGRIATAGLHHLPPPGPHHDVEAWIRPPFLTDPRGVWNGRVDSAYTLDNGEPEILDHKTTSDLGYAKTVDDLRQDVQANVYAYAALTVTDSDAANLRWVYYRTRPPYKAVPVRVRLTRKHVYGQIRRWEAIASRMLDAIEAKKKALDLPPNVLACSAFGGCPHRQRCALTGEDMVRSGMKNERSLLDKVNALRNAGGLPSAGPPPAPAAPVFAAAPPPPPPPPPPAEAWVAHPNDSAWEWNPATGELRRATVVAAPPPPPPPAPPAAPPAPPAPSATVLAASSSLNPPEVVDAPLRAEPEAALAEPAEPADDSKVGDRFDTMDVAALRAFAKEHGITGTKGLRERNLRHLVRSAWTDRQRVAPAEAPAASVEPASVEPIPAPPAPAPPASAAPPAPPAAPAPLAYVPPAEQVFMPQPQPSGLTLYVDCAPRRRLAVSVREAFLAEVESVARDEGVDDYRMIAYGQGPVRLELAVRRRQRKAPVTGAVVLDTRTDLGRHLLGVLSELADEVVASL